MCLYSHGILPNVKFPSLKFETNTCIARLYNVKITCLILYIFVCSSALYIPGDDFIFEKDTPFILTCVNAKNESNINFKFDNNLLGTCYSRFGCNNLGKKFNISAIISTYPRQYFLRSVHNFDTTLCGTYQCTDIDTNIQDSVQVSYKEFNNNSFFVEETDDALNISTACVFPASYTDLEVSWFIFDNSSLRGLNLTSDNGFITVVTATSACPDVTCNNISAKSFQFGLKFNNYSDSFPSVFVEIKIVHTLFPDKPLVWRSSKVYQVEENMKRKHISSPAKHTGWSVGTIIGIACVAGGTLLLIAGVAVALVKWRKNKTKSMSKQIERFNDKSTSEDVKTGSVKSTSEDVKTGSVKSTSEDVETGSVKSTSEDVITVSVKSTSEDVETVSVKSSPKDDEISREKLDAPSDTSSKDETDSDISKLKDSKTDPDISKLTNVIGNANHMDGKQGSGNSMTKDVETTSDGKEDVMSLKGSEVGS